MSAASQLEARLRDRLAQLRADNLTRVMRPPAGVDLSSNDYLQLSMHPSVTAAFADGLAAEGAGSTGSRLLRGERCALRRDHICHASLECGDQVELAFDHDRRTFVDQRSLRFVQAEEHRAFGE